MFKLHGRRAVRKLGSSNCWDHGLLGASILRTPNGPQVLSILCPVASLDAGNLLRWTMPASLIQKMGSGLATTPAALSLDLYTSHLRSEWVPEVPSNSEFSNPLRDESDV